MANLQELKGRIKSIKSIHKITSAMELVSIAKSKRYVKTLMQVREFYESVIDLFYNLSKDNDEVASKFLNGKEDLFIIIGSDIGLCGAFNQNLFKLIGKDLKPQDYIITIGKKPTNIVTTRYGIKPKEFYMKVPFENYEQLASEISDIIYNKLMKQELNSVSLVYTRFNNQISFQPIYAKILPVNDELLKQILGDERAKNLDSQKNKDLAIPIYEPNGPTIIKYTLKLYFNAIILGALRESYVSEHSTRRLAMENATTNGEDLIDRLSLEINHIRQAKITQEISEIISGSEAT